MAINTYLLTTESKKQTKQTRSIERDYEYGECVDGCQMEVVCRGMGEEVRGFKTHKKVVTE